MLFQHRPRHERDALVTLAAFVIPFLVYLRTLAPTVHAMALADRATVYGLDSAEFAAGACSLGIVHAPGYPLYLLIGKGFSYLPFGGVAYRLNLMSAFFAALTVMVLYRLVFRLTRHTLVSFCAALFLAFSYYFWTAAIVAEVYTLHAFLSVYLHLPWRYRAATAFNYAGHYDANGVFHGVDQTTLDGLWWMLSGRPFKGLMFSHRWSETVRELKNHVYWLWSNFLAVGIVPGVLGAARLFITRGRFAFSLLLIYLANLVFFATCRILDTESMYIPTYLIWAVWMGIGGQYMLEAIADWENQSQEDSLIVLDACERTCYSDLTPFWRGSHDPQSDGPHKRRRSHEPDAGPPGPGPPFAVGNRPRATGYLCQVPGRAGRKGPAHPRKEPALARRLSG